MKLHLVIGQRQESYPGEYAPEALAVFDETLFDEHPEIVRDRIGEIKDEDDFESVILVDVEVDAAAARAIDGTDARSDTGRDRGDAESFEIHVLLGRHKEEPERLRSLAVIDGVGLENGNPDYLIEQRARLQAKGEYLATSIAVLRVARRPILAALRPARLNLTAEVLRVVR